MSALSAGTEAALFAQTLGRGLGVAVKGRRLAAVGTVLGQPGFYGVDALLQDVDVFL
jgi:hypothetical protein